jgi:hypothetical protein
MRHRRGFAAFTALTLLAIVSIALETLAVFANSEARRTRGAADDAQLQALLLAGATDARDSIITGQTEIDVALPSQLEGAKLHIMRTQPNPTGASFVILATFGGKTASEKVDFALRGQSWVLTAASLSE